MSPSRSQSQLDRMAVDLLGDQEYNRLRRLAADQVDEETLEARKRVERQRTLVAFLVFLLIGAGLWVVLHLWVS